MKKQQPPPPMPKTFAEAIRDADVAKLAVAVGVRTQSVYQWRRGRTLPNIGHLEAIGKATGWPTAVLQQLVLAELAARGKDQKAARR